jgi:hypothetical protein
VTIAAPGGSSVSDGFCRPHFWISSWSDWREMASSSAARLMFQVWLARAWWMSAFSTLGHKALAPASKLSPTSPGRSEKDAHPVGKLDTWEAVTARPAREIVRFQVVRRLARELLIYR